MPTPAPAGFKLGALAPEDAISAFERRGVPLPSFRWHDVWQDEHARGFAVAGVSRIEVLNIFRKEVKAAVDQGMHPADFAANLQPKLAAHGFWGDVEVKDDATKETRITRFDDRRLKLIFDVNMRQSQAAGRWARIERSKATLPYVMYRTAQDDRVRQLHQAWDGVVLPVDDEFWHTHYPPNGWRCRCIAFAVDGKTIDSMRAAGVKIKTERPPTDWINFVHGPDNTVTPVPRGIDPGFAYNPGKTRDAALFDATMRKAAPAQPLGAAEVVAQAQADLPGMVAKKTAEFGPWVDKVLTTGQARGEVQYVGAMLPQVVRALSKAGVEPSSAALAVRDHDVLHALRAAKGDAALTVEAYRRLPELLANATALLIDRRTSPVALLYIVELPNADGSVAKMVVMLDYRVRLVVEGKRATVPLNIVRTVTTMDPHALADRASYELVWGVLP